MQLINTHAHTQYLIVCNANSTIQMLHNKYYIANFERYVRKAKCVLEAIAKNTFA